MNRFFLIIVSVILSSCTTFAIKPLDPNTRHFPSSVEAKMVTNNAVDLDSMRELILVPGDTNVTYVKQMINNIGYFGRVIFFDTLENEIIQANLTTKIPTITDKISLSNAAKNYKPFLWLQFRKRIENYVAYQQIVLTNATDMKDLFVAEVVFDNNTDQSVWYPLFNKLIDYIRDKSSSYR